MYNLKSGDSVLVLWQDVNEKELLDFVSKLRSVVTELGSVQLENISFFNQSEYLNNLLFYSNSEISQFITVRIFLYVVKQIMVLTAILIASVFRLF